MELIGFGVELIFIIGIIIGIIIVVAEAGLE